MRTTKSKVAGDVGEGVALRHRPRSRSRPRSGGSLEIEKCKEFDVAEDEDPGLRDERGYRGIRVRPPSLLFCM